MNDLQKALSLIEAQQKKAGAGTPAWCVGQQLADILNGQPAAAQIVADAFVFGPRDDAHARELRDAAHEVRRRLRGRDERDHDL